MRSRISRAGGFLSVALLCAACGEQDPDYNFDIPYVPTPQPIVDRMLELADVGPSDYVIDLGSGDGRILITAAKARGARGLGVDINTKLVEEANQTAKREGLADKVSFRRQDLFETSISEATVVALYLPTSVNLKLRPRLLSELRPGSRIVSHAFGMGGWLPDRQENVRGIDVFLWIVPANVDGAWTVTDGERRFGVTFRQQFQEIAGSATMEGRAIPLREARINGDRIEFSVELVAGSISVYRGRVNADRMAAEPQVGGPSWSAVRVR